ncbi:hypothetical protein HDU97_009978 [Phlyctochytrium planicorne]|nr:hypothetical protein HDU97_009978 [Phlyctochytrium planicorne]
MSRMASVMEVRITALITIMLASMGMEVAADTQCSNFNVFSVPYDIYGYDIDSKGVDATSSCSCASKCGSESRCTFFSFDKEDGLCYMKRTLENGGFTYFLTSNNDFLALDGAIGDEASRNKRLGVSSNVDEATCKRYCRNNSDCRYASLLDGECKWYRGSGQTGIVGVNLKSLSAPKPSAPPPTPSPSQSPSPQPSPTDNTPPSVPSDVTSSTAIPSSTNTSDSLSSTVTSASIQSQPPSNQQQQNNTILLVSTVFKEGGSSPTAGSNSSDASSGGLPAGLVPGLSVGAGVLLIVSAVMLFIAHKRKPKKRDSLSGSSTESSRTPPPQQQPHQQSFPMESISVTMPRSPSAVASLNVPPSNILPRSSPEYIRPFPLAEKSPSKVGLSPFPTPSWSTSPTTTKNIASDPANIDFSRASNTVRNQNSVESMDSAAALLPQGLHRDITLTPANAKLVAAGESEKFPVKGSYNASSQPSPMSNEHSAHRNLANPEILSWTTNDVSNALVSAGVSTSYVEILRDNNVNGYSLLVLNEDRLKGMGVEPQSARMLVLTAVNILRSDRSIAEAPPQYF